jgi:hypothetical protein
MSTSSTTAGTITFKGGGYDEEAGSDADFIETINGKIVHAIIGCEIINGKTMWCRPICNTSGVWTSDGYTLGLSYYGGPGPTLTIYLIRSEIALLYLIINYYCQWRKK